MREKLKMTRGDIETTISQEFRKRLAELKFSNQLNFSKMEEGNFSLLKKYEGAGEYSVEGSAKLSCQSKDGMSYDRYHLSFTVHVSEVDRSPKIEIISPVISCSKCYTAI